MQLQFFQRNDRAVSPVIAVILMVAITVVLAATVYVWVTGFSATSPQAASLSLSQSVPLTTSDATAASRCGAGSTWCANFTIVSASPGFTAGNLKVTDSTTDVGAISCKLNGATITTATTTSLSAGDQLSCAGTAADPTLGDQLNFVDTRAGSIIATLSLR